MKKRAGNIETPMYKKALAWAALSGYEAWRENTGVLNSGRYRFGFTGKPDIVGYHRTTGVALFVECKQDGLRLRQEQYDFLKRAAVSCCQAWVWTEKDMYRIFDLPEEMKPKGAK